jgi:hypothetical protein
MRPAIPTPRSPRHFLRKALTETPYDTIIRKPSTSPPRVDQVRRKIEMRHRFDAAAASSCGINLKRFLQEKEDR